MYMQADWQPMSTRRASDFRYSFSAGRHATWAAKPNAAVVKKAASPPNPSRP